MITGPRRAGKTTYLKALFPDYKYITLDDFDYLEMAQKDPKALALLHPRLIIDEAQRVPKISIAVKYALDEKQSIIHLTGSSKIGLLDAGFETLAGRIIPQSLPTLCFGEDAGEWTHRIFEDQLGHIELKEAQRKLESGLTYGGFPEVALADEFSEKETILKNYRDTYFTRDLAFLSNIESVEGLMAILKHLQQSIGSLTQVSNFRRESGLSHPSAKKYLNVLYQSELAFKIYGHQFGPAKRLLKAAKSYYADNGVIFALGDSVSKGQWVENFVISELEKRRKLGFYPIDQLYYYQTNSGGEIDLIMEFEDHLKLIEIKSSDKVSKKDVRNLLSYQKTVKRETKAYLFYLGETYLELEGVQVIPIAAFYRGV